MSYTAYRSMGELWLTSIPKHWSNRKIKYTFSERVEKGYPEEPLLVASQNMGVVPKEVYGNRTVEATKDLHNLKLVRIGDFVISLRSFQGGLEYAYYQGIISPAYTVMVPNAIISNGYFRYLAKSKLFIELLQMCVTGIREGQNIDYNKLKNHLIPLPPREEQDQIVRYLDWKVSQINRLVNAKRRQIVLLGEQMQAVINKYLISDKSIRLSICTTKIGSGKTPRGGTAVYVESGVLFIRSQNIYPFQLTKKGAYYITDDIDDEMKSTRIYRNDVLLNITGGSIGRCSVYRSDDRANVNQHVCIIRTKPELLLSDYLELWFNSFAGQNTIRKCQNAGNRESLTFVQIAGFEVPFLPVDRQNQIIHEVQSLLEPINKVIEKYEQEIILLQEYRTRLISDVVTGKLDVRDVAVPEYEIVEETEDKLALMEEETEETGE